MKNVILISFLLLTIFPNLADAQANRWKRTRYEIVAGIGSTAFMGDLGGGKASSHFISDFDFTSQRYLITGGLRYQLLQPLSVKGAITYGMLSGSDEKAADIYRKDRNLSFRSPIIELSAQLEYSIIPEPLNYRYNLKKRRGFSFKSLLAINTYVFAGVSAFYFNPKGKDDGVGGTGKWVALQPLGTEGQGLMEGREKYSRIQLAIPFGFGFKYGITRSLNIGLEYGARWTFTDYIDDVSTTYIDNDWLASKNPQAARMADKSIRTDDDSDPRPGVRYAPGDQRGESKYNDYYMFTMITITYKLRTGKNGLPKF
jgi:hypothetical protein